MNQLKAKLTGSFYSYRWVPRFESVTRFMLWVSLVLLLQMAAMNVELLVAIVAVVAATTDW